LDFRRKTWRKIDYRQNLDVNGQVIPKWIIEKQGIRRINDRPVLSSEMAPHVKKIATVL
jgi:hypothetical protein